MKKFLLGTVAAVALGAAPAIAADLGARPYTKAPPMLAPIYNWTGFYIGGHVGGAWAGNNNIDANGGRFLGGLQAGADYQFAQNWVMGVEGQYSWLSNGNNNGTTFPILGVATRTDRGLGSVTGRLGWTWGPGLLYAKGGYAFTDTSLGVTVAGVPVPFAVTGNSKNGFTVGAGLEYMLAPNWSVKGEYQYYNFSNTTFAPLTPVGLLGQTFRNDEHTIKAGVNYRFGGWQ
jgi:outer membrane immunogenic protein